MLTAAPPSGAPLAHLLLAHLRTRTRTAHDRLGLDVHRMEIEWFYRLWRNWEPQMAVLFQDAAFLNSRRRVHLP